MPIFDYSKDSFDYSKASLNDPTSIEASAGTGKTYTLEHLILRYLTEKSVLSKPLNISDILVVTFTEKATREMKERIRHLIQKESKKNHPKLEEALNDFSQSAIYTIHSFCQKTLREFNFYSGLPFDMEHALDTWYVEECLWDLFRNEEISPQEYEILQNAFNIKNHEKLIDFILNAYYQEIGNAKYSIIKPSTPEMVTPAAKKSPLMKKIAELKDLLNNIDLPRDFIHLPKNIYKAEKIPLYQKELKTIADATNLFFYSKDIKAIYKLEKIHLFYDR